MSNMATALKGLSALSLFSEEFTELLVSDGFVDGFYLKLEGFCVIAPFQPIDPFIYSWHTMLESTFSM